jgi:hypothetical protein
MVLSSPSVLIKLFILYPPNPPMSLISIEQYHELAEDYPELAQCIHIHDDEEDLIADTSGD